MGEISDIKTIVTKNEGTLELIKEILISRDNTINQKLDLLKNQLDSIKKLHEKLEKDIEQVERTFTEEQTRQNLLQSNLKLVTTLTPFRREGSRKCWERGYFFDEDVRSGFDARRPIITDDIIESIENNDGTILFGDAYYGKSVILRRVMFEEIERGYMVVFGDNIEANTNQLVELLNRISKDYPKILFIADNVHRTAGEVIFAAFNRIEPGKIRFLFAARENELDRNNKPEIDRAFENIPPEAEYRVGFDLTDALLFMRQAINVSYQVDADETDMKFAEEMYQYSKRDPFMFNLGIKYRLSEGRKAYEDFIALDIENKIKLLKDKDAKDWKAPLLCSILGIVGRSVSLQTSTGLLACSGIIPYSFESLVQQDFLIKQVEFKQEQYRVRHEKYAAEFLVYLYRTYFGNNPDLFDKTHGIRHIINCVWDNIAVDAIIDILEVCSSFYHIESYRPLSELITTDYVVPYARFVTPSHLSEPEKVRLFCYGLGNFYSNRKDYIHSIEYYDQSIKIDSNFIDAWNNKGTSSW